MFEKQVELEKFCKSVLEFTQYTYPTLYNIFLLQKMTGARFGDASKFYLWGQRGSGQWLYTQEKTGRNRVVRSGVIIEPLLNLPNNEKIRMQFESRAKANVIIRRNVKARFFQPNQNFIITHAFRYLYICELVEMDWTNEMIAEDLGVYDTTAMHYINRNILA